MLRQVGQGSFKVNVQLSDLRVSGRFSGQQFFDLLFVSLGLVLDLAGQLGHVHLG